MSSNKITKKIYKLLSDYHRQLKWIYTLISYKFHQLKPSQILRFQELKYINYSAAKKVKFTSGKLTLTGDLFSSKNITQAPCILLIHGSAIFGRKSPLIQGLAHEFHRLGYTVLALDLRGYGESDDPQDYHPKGFDFAQDVESALDFLVDYVGVSSDKFYLVGHSFGGGVALAAQARDQRIKKIVSFGPPRRLSERFINQRARDRHKLLVRWQGDMQLDKPLNFPFWREVMETINLERYVQDFAIPGHTPVFLIDASQEPEADLQFMRDVLQNMIPPVEHWTVPGTGHYLNCGFLFTLPFYHQPLVKTFVNCVDQWLKLESGVESELKQVF